MFTVKAHPRLHWEHGDKLVWGALVLVILEAGEENGEKYFDLIWPAFDDQLSFYGKKYWIDKGLIFPLIFVPIPMTFYSALPEIICTTSNYPCSTSPTHPI